MYKGTPSLSSGVLAIDVVWGTTWRGRLGGIRTVGFGINSLKSEKFAVGMHRADSQHSIFTFVF